MNKIITALALAIFLYVLMTPALGISVGFSAGNGGEIVSSSSAYDLDRSASLQESASIGNGEISSDLTAMGSGNNRISISSSTKENTAGIDIESSGNFQTSASTGASGEGVGISQGTTMSGSHGGITALSDSPGNKMVISSGFDGEGDLTASISAAAGENAAISGNVNALGVEMLDSESLQALASGDLAMSVDGLYSQPNGGMRSFGLSASNTKKEVVIDRAGAYALTGLRWNTKNPQLKFVVKNDANLKAEGLTGTAVQSAITAAGNTWDDATTQNLFADSGMVTLDPNVIADSYNKINTVSWKPFASGCPGIAYLRNWYSLTKVDGYKTIKESDIVFNTLNGWSTAGATLGIDVQSVALHEMGHALGLADIYGTPEFTQDTRQVMHYYIGEKRKLGNGDTAGIKKLYG